MDYSLMSSEELLALYDKLDAQIDALDNKQMSLKILANSGYGAVTNSGFRYFDLRIGEAITLTGQASDRHVEKNLNEYMNKVMKTEGIDYVTYGDTDSLYLNVHSLVKSLFKEGDFIDKIVKTLDKVGLQIQKSAIQKSIDEVYEMCNCFEKLMDMKREAIYSKAFWTAKKRYAMIVHNSEGVDYKPYKMKIMGLDIVKSSTPKKIRKVLKDSLFVIFEQGEIPLREFVAEFKSHFNEMPVEDISFPRSASDIGKWMQNSSYGKGTPMHVRGAILFNNALRDTKLLQFVNNTMSKYDNIRNGDKIKYVYLQIPNPIKENVISFPSAGILPPEFGLHKYVDYDLMFEKCFISPLKSITDAIGWQIEEQSSLEEFFG